MSSCSECGSRNHNGYCITHNKKVGPNGFCAQFRLPGSDEVEKDDSNGVDK